MASRIDGRRRWLIALCLAGAITSPDWAVAADAAPRVLEEVLVTATRRGDVALQTTPVAVTALGGEDVESLVPRDLGDIAVMVPNFSAGKPAGFNAAAFAMRGVGQTAIIVYADAHVGVTVDDFVIPHVQTQVLEMFDIERIEVLRGPQGTLFGKNTTGGVINVRTKRPVMDELGADIGLRVGSYGRREGRFAVNVPLVEGQFALRASGIKIDSDGYFENGASYGPVATVSPNHPAAGETGEGNGEDIGGDDVFSGRLKLAWEPTETFSALLQYEYIRDNGDTPPLVNGTPNDPALVFFNLGLTADPGDPLDHAGVTNRDDLLLDMSDGHQVDVDGYYLNLDWTFGDLTLSSVTGYREQESRLPSTYPGEVGPVSLFDANRADDRETFQQEIRLASASAGPFNFVAGAFYQEDTTTFCVVQVLGFLDLLGLGEAAFNDPTFFDNNPQILCNEQDASNWAVFGDVNYDFSDKLTLGAGLRYTSEEKEWIGRHQVFIQALTGGFDPNLTWQTLGTPLAGADFERFPFGVFEDDEDWSELTWRATVGYRHSDNVYAYFTYSRGFKSGAYNDQTGTSGTPITAATAAPTDPETADSFEVGVKLDLLDQRLRLDLIGFHVIYDDAQRDLVAEFQNPFGGTFQETRFFNAAEVTASGIEAELTALVTDRLMVRANLGYIDAEYDRFEADTDFDGVTDIDLSGRPVNRAPELQGGIDVRYTHALSGGELEWGLNVSYEDESVFVYSQVSPDFDAIADERTLVNASITFTDADDRFFVRLFGQNLTDEEYRVGELPVANLWTMSYYGPPRTYGVEVGLNFSR
ncbi:MAG TPA: TonB-dependent receptor [Pseudomonadales bacterium]